MSCDLVLNFSGRPTSFCYQFITRSILLPVLVSTSGGSKGARGHALQSSEIFSKVRFSEFSDFLPPRVSGCFSFYFSIIFPLFTLVDYEE